MRLSLTKDLAPLKAEAKDDIDRQAGEIRKLFVTEVPAQSMVYQQKKAEAEAYLSGEETDEENLPHLAAEADMNGISVHDQATIIMTMANQWATISAIIERRRLEAKQVVDAATTPAQIKAATEIDWSDVEAMA